jgi:exopolysaccharide biosynthesis protein
MVVKGTLVNYPTDPTGERPVSDAIVVRGPG